MPAGPSCGAAQSEAIGEFSRASSQMGGGEVVDSTYACCSNGRCVIVGEAPHSLAPEVEGSGAKEGGVWRLLPATRHGLFQRVAGST
jgi:hypothetical protein